MNFLRRTRRTHANIAGLKRFYNRTPRNVKGFKATSIQDNEAAENKKPSLQCSAHKFGCRDANKKNILDFFLPNKKRRTQRSQFHSFAISSLISTKSLKPTSSSKQNSTKKSHQKVNTSDFQREFSSAAFPFESDPEWSKDRPYMNYDDETLYLLCKAFQVPKIQEERMRREIMDVDQSDVAHADFVLEEMSGLLNSRATAYKIPYGVGLFFLGGSFIASIPMVFSKNMAIWFNEHYVTMDLPEVRDLETMLEVGSWTWSWMEPPLGTASFCILAAQYCKSYMVKLGIAPYRVYFRSQNIVVLQEKYPRFDRDIVKDFVDSKQFFYD